MSLIAAANYTSPSLNQRSQMLTRILAQDVNAVSDCEMLELFLSQVPSITHPQALAIRLLERFGALHKVMYEEDHVLKSIEGVDDAAVNTITTLRCMLQRLAKSTLLDQPVIQSWSVMMEYCKLMSGHSKVEEFRVLFLNHRHALMADEVMQRGTVNHTPVYVREIVKRALELSASAIILVHNHPSGDPAPSKADNRY
jgi:DNA repair protein RadC